MAAECVTSAITLMARLPTMSTSGYYKRAKRSVTTASTNGQQRRHAEMTAATEIRVYF
jgi:putative transposase